jgi:hypothetical protein
LSEDKQTSGMEKKYSDVCKYTVRGKLMNGLNI